MGPEILDVWEVNLLRGREDSNKLLHHTKAFNSEFLIVRRGQEFQVQITFSRPYKPAEDKFAVEFVIGASPAGPSGCVTDLGQLTVPSLPGSSPQYSKGTYVPVFPTAERQSSWLGRVLSSSASVVTLGITPVADCIVGKYHMYIAVSTPFGTRRTKRDPSRDVYVLFNPWVSGGSHVSADAPNISPPFMAPSSSSFSQRTPCSWTMRTRGRSV